MILCFEIYKNITLANLKDVSFLKVINSSKEKKMSKHFIDILNIKSFDENQIVRYLSGGNQQKVVLAKYLFANFNLLIMDDPTVGIDVGAKIDFYKLVNNIAAEGKSIIFISSDVMEVLGVSDRIIVLSEGKMVNSYNSKEVNEETLIKAIFAHK